MVKTQPAPIAARLRWLSGSVALVLASLLVWLFWPARAIPVVEHHADTTDPVAMAATIERGRYLSVLGNCQGCHSLPGQRPYAGGTPIATPFGTVFGPNLTPSAQGLGSWSAADFWRALHHGQAPDGRWLNPAFPYTHTTRVSREDSNALFAYLQHLPADETPNRPHALRWPYGTQAALKVWRALYFTPGPSTQSPTPPRDDIERGRQLVDGLAHCSACHTPRGPLGGPQNDAYLQGAPHPSGKGRIPAINRSQLGWSAPDIAEYLSSGFTPDYDSAGGDMVDVIENTSRLPQSDRDAIARYIHSID